MAKKTKSLTSWATMKGAPGTRRKTACPGLIPASSPGATFVIRS